TACDLAARAGAEAVMLTAAGDATPRPAVLAAFLTVGARTAFLSDGAVLAAVDAAAVVVAAVSAPAAFPPAAFPPATGGASSSIDAASAVLPAFALPPDRLGVTLSIGESAIV